MEVCKYKLDASYYLSLYQNSKCHAPIAIYNLLFSQFQFQDTLLYTGLFNLSTQAGDSYNHHRISSGFSTHFTIPKTIVLLRFCGIFIYILVLRAYRIHIACYDWLCLTLHEA